MGIVAVKASRGISLIDQSYQAVPRTCDGATDTTAVVLASIVVPGGAMGKNGRVEVIMEWTWTGTAQKFLKLDWGGSNMFGPSYTTANSISHRVAIFNTNSLAAQKVQNSSSFNTNGAYNTATKDTSGNVTIDIKVNWQANTSAGTEVITLNGYSAWVYPAP